MLWAYACEKGITVKPVLSGHSKKDKAKISMTNGSLMKVESIAECSHWSILQYFWPALSVIGIENQFLVFLRVAVLDRFYCKSITRGDEETHYWFTMWTAEARTGLCFREVISTPLLLSIIRISPKIVLQHAHESLACSQKQSQDFSWVTVVPSKSDSEVILCLQLLCKIFTYPLDPTRIDSSHVY